MLSGYGKLLKKNPTRYLLDFDQSHTLTSLEMQSDQVMESEKVKRKLSSELDIDQIHTLTSLEVQSDQVQRWKERGGWGKLPDRYLNFQRKTGEKCCVRCCSFIDRCLFVCLTSSIRVSTAEMKKNLPSDDRFR